MKKRTIKLKSWHHPAKVIERGRKGKCKICEKTVKNLEEHMRRVHKGKNI